SRKKPPSPLKRGEGWGEGVSGIMTSDLARRMRRQATKAEIRLWQRLRNRQLEDTKFRRQVPIGAYIADFATKEKRLIIEVDGGQHGIAADADEARSRELARLCYRVIRFWNGDVLKNTDGVIEAIREALIGINDRLTACSQK